MNTRTLKKHLKYIVPEIRLALIKEPGTKAIPVTCPGDIEKFVEPLKHYAEEHFVSFHLNCRNEITGYQIVSHGTVSASLVHPREVFKSAVMSNSHGIIVAHNHPGGSLTPSPEDIETTEQLIKAGKILGVPVVDHIIVSHNGYRSLRETQGYLWG
jgi:DNA repair protein RadC